MERKSQGRRRGGASGYNSPVTFGGYVCISMGLVWVVVVIIFSRRRERGEMGRGAAGRPGSQSARPGDRPGAGFTLSGPGTAA